MPQQPEYWVRDGSGQKSGPVDLETLRSWASEGRVSADDQVYDPLTTRWVLATDLQQLNGCFPGSASSVVAAAAAAQPNDAREGKGREHSFAKKAPPAVGLFLARILGLVVPIGLLALLGMLIGLAQRTREGGPGMGPLETKIMVVFALIMVGGTQAWVPEGYTQWYWRRRALKPSAKAEDVIQALLVMSRDQRLIQVARYVKPSTEEEAAFLADFLEEVAAEKAAQSSHPTEE